LRLQDLALEQKGELLIGLAMTIVMLDENGKEVTLEANLNR